MFNYIIKEDGSEVVDISLKRGKMLNVESSVSRDTCPEEHNDTFGTLRHSDAARAVVASSFCSLLHHLLPGWGIPA